jgi:hypothetical protein
MRNIIKDFNYKNTPQSPDFAHPSIPHQALQNFQRQTISKIFRASQQVQSAATPLTFFVAPVNFLQLHF